MRGLVEGWTAIGVIASVIAALGVVGAAIGGWYTRTRWALSSKVRRLTPGMALARFEHVLGSPHFTEPHQDNHLVVHTWANRHCYVQALSDGPTVKAVSVTTRRKRLRIPVLSQVMFGEKETAEVRIGRTAVGDIRGRPTGLQAVVGANWWTYRESYYFGRPGGYRYYIFSINEAGYHAKANGQLVGLLVEHPKYAGDRGDFAGGGDQKLDADDDDLDSLLDRPDFRQVRAKAIPNTYTISDLPVLDHASVLPLGPSILQMQMLDH